MTAEAIDLAVTPPLGPTFVDYPLDVVFMEAEADPPEIPARVAEPADGVEEAAKLLSGAERPAIMAGSNVYWGRAEAELRAARRGPRRAGLPQRHGAGLHAARPRALLLPGPRRRARAAATSPW